MKNKIFTFILVTFLCALSFGVGGYLANYFSKEVVNLKEFTEYYENDLVATGGWEVQKESFYHFEKIYDLKDKSKLQEDINKENLVPEKITYIVKAGDTLSGIASENGLDLNIVRMYNPNVSSKKLKIGQKLTLVNQNGIFYKVKKGDNLNKIATYFKVKIEDIKKINKLDSDTLQVGNELFIKEPNLTKYLVKQTAKKKSIAKQSLGFRMPIKYSGISSPFGNRFHPVLKRYIFHSGVDLRARFIPVRASKGGRVTYAGWMRGYGKIIIIKHNNGYETRYAHLDKIGVKKGSYVNQGDLIAKSGQSGRVTGPHLHFEIRRNGKALNPMRYVSRR